MTDILDLPGWKALGTRLDGDEYEIEAEYTEHPDVCQKCGAGIPGVSNDSAGRD